MELTRKIVNILIIVLTIQTMVIMRIMGIIKMLKTATLIMMSIFFFFCGKVFIFQQVRIRAAMWGMPCTAVRPGNSHTVKPETNINNIQQIFPCGSCPNLPRHNNWAASPPSPPYSTADNYTLPVLLSLSTKSFTMDTTYTTIILLKKAVQNVKGKKQILLWIFSLCAG